MKHVIDITIRIIAAIFAVYMLFCLTAYIKPEWFLYKPDMNRPNLEDVEDEIYNPQEVVYKSADGTELFGWYTAPKNKNYTVVFMHGNSYNIEKFYNKMLPFIEEGYGTFMGEYRGFGGIKGKINQENLQNDAIAAVEYLKSLGYENGNLIIYGMSLGSHMAVNTVYKLQDKGEFAALILEVPFDSLENVAIDRVKGLLPLDLILQDKYDNVAMIKEVRSPIFISAAQNDKVVPIERAKRLFENAPNPKVMIEYPEARHDNLYEYKNYEAILKWLE